MKLNRAIVFLLMITSSLHPMDERQATIAQILHGDHGPAQLICDMGGYFIKSIFVHRPGWNIALEGIEQLVCGKFVTLSWQTTTGWQTYPIKTRTRRPPCFSCCHKPRLLDEWTERIVDIKRGYPPRPGQCRALARDGTVITELGAPGAAIFQAINLKNEQHIEITAKNNQPSKNHDSCDLSGTCSEFELRTNQRVCCHCNGNVFYALSTHNNRLLLSIQKDHEPTLNFCFELSSGREVDCPEFWQQRRFYPHAGTCSNPPPPR